MKTLPIGSEGYRRLNPHLYGAEPVKALEMPDSAPKKRIRQSSRTMNSLEQEFFTRLKLQYSNVYYEPMRMRLCNGEEP